MNTEEFLQFPYQTYTERKVLQLLNNKNIREKSKTNISPPTPLATKQTTQR